MKRRRFNPEAGAGETGDAEAEVSSQLNSDGGVDDDMINSTGNPGLSRCMGQTREDIEPSSSRGLFQRIRKTHYPVEHYASLSNIMVYRRVG